METFHEIKQNLQKQRNEEFQKFNVIIESNTVINKEDINKVSYDIRKFTSKLQKQQYLSSLKGKKVKDYDIGDNLINMESIQDNIERKGWGDLSSIEKKKKIKNFLDTLQLNSSLYEAIVNKRIYKKDVQYNIFSSSIENLNFLKLENGEYKIVKKKVKKKKQKIFK